MSSLTATDCTQTIVDLIERQPIEIAVDTEFKGIHTLTVQVATRGGTRSDRRPSLQIGRDPQASPRFRSR